MSLPKKGTRKIFVNNIEYTWLVKDKGNCKSIVMQQIDEGQILFCSSSAWDISGMYRIAITPAKIREIIEKALVEGWRPTEKGLKRFNVKYPIEDKTK